MLHLDFKFKKKIVIKFEVSNLKNYEVIGWGGVKLISWQGMTMQRVIRLREILINIIKQYLHISRRHLVFIFREIIFNYLDKF